MANVMDTIKTKLKILRSIPFNLCISCVMIGKSLVRSFNKPFNSPLVVLTFSCTAVAIVFNISILPFKEDNRLSVGFEGIGTGKLGTLIFYIK